MLVETDSDPGLSIGTQVSMTTSPVPPPRPASVVTRRFRAMNTDVTLQVVNPATGVRRAVMTAQRVFEQVEDACTRFRADSPLMLANAAGEEWYPVPIECLLAIEEAHEAHQATGGLFDPRVLTALVGLGYDRTLPFGEGAVRLQSAGSGTAPTDLPQLAGAAGAPSGAGRPGPTHERWHPGIDHTGSQVRIGPTPIDLGGIGKGLAVRWAAERLAGVGDGYLVEAGGDCALGGHGPDGPGWRVGVEDPAGGSEHVAVLELTDIGCATSSTRKRTWQLDGRQVHHVIDPRTGTSAGGGLRAVTVVHPDPARAEVWSKTLMIVGRDEVAALAAEHQLAALWVDDHGRLGATSPMLDHVIWSAEPIEG